MPYPRNFYRKEAIKNGHSEDYINAVLAYVDGLEARDLPIIFSLLHFSLLVGLRFRTTQIIVNNSSKFYKTYKIRKKRGGNRDISSPFRSLKIMQQYINQYILSNIPIHDKAYGFIRGKSILDNAKLHLNKECILNIDLHNFFGTITSKQVYSIFLNMGYASNLAVDFTNICTAALDKNLRHVLPQGAPTSPALSNIRAFQLDKRLDNFAKKNDIVYSRYADDITFSGNRKNLPKVSFLKKVIEDENFILNSSKIRLYTKHSNKRIVTGLLVDSSVRIPKKFKKEIYRHLHFCKKYSPEEHIAYHDEKRGNRKDYFYDWLKGKISFVKMIEPNEGLKMFNEFNKIDWGLK